MTIYCCMPDCKETSDNGARLFQVPKSEERPLTRERWLKNIRLTEPIPELLFFCEKHYTICQQQNEEMQDCKSSLPWNSVPIKVDDAEDTDYNLELNLKTFVIYPNKQEKSGDVLEILANSQSTKSSSVATDSEITELEAPASHCDVVLTNPFLEVNTAIELESSEDETVEINKIQCIKVVPLQNLQAKNKTKNAKRKRKKKRHLKQRIRRAMMEDLQNAWKTLENPEPPKVQAEIVTINVDSSDDDVQEIEQSDSPKTDVGNYVTQECEQPKSSEVLELEEKLQIARKRVSELSQELHNTERNLKKIFNLDQICRLKNSQKKMFKWKAKTLKKALQLFFTCGEAGYKCLLNQNYPFPSVNVLQRIIFDFKIGSEVVGKTVPAGEPNARSVQEIVDRLIINQLNTKT